MITAVPLARVVGNPMTQHPAEEAAQRHPVEQGRRLRDYHARVEAEAQRLQQAYADLSARRAHQPDRD